jgi:hypothetical protein
VAAGVLRASLTKEFDCFILSELLPPNDYSTTAAFWLAFLSHPELLLFIKLKLEGLDDADFFSSSFESLLLSFFTSSLKSGDGYSGLLDAECTPIYLFYFYSS